MKKSKINITCGISLLTSLFLFFISLFTESTVLPDGTLYEPYFFLIPLGDFFLFVSLILFIISLIKNKKKTN